MEPCIDRPLFRRLGILTILSRYILSALVYVKDNLEHFKTKGNQDIDRPYCRLSKKKDGFPLLVYGLLNHLPDEVRNVVKEKFILTLTNYLLLQPTQFFDTPPTISS